MEQKSGPTGDAAAGIMGEQPEPGELRRWTWQAIANGADGVVYFRWRVCLTGAEQYWHGILDHDGMPRRRYREVRKTSHELDKVRKLVEGTTVKSKVALIRSFENLWLLERQPGASGFHYDEHCFELYRAVKRRGLSVDMVDSDAELGDYSVVLAPALAIVDAVAVERLTRFVQGGGTLVLTPQSGTRTPAAAMTDTTHPGLLAELVGASIEEVRPYHRGQTSEISFARGALVARKCAVGRWIEVLECGKAEAIAEYRDEAFAGKPAITRNTVGKGSVYYMGVYLPADILHEFLDDLLPEFAIKNIPEGVEVTQRRGPEGRLVFVLNHTGEPQALRLPSEFTDLLSGEKVGPKIKLSRNGVLVLKAAL
jgi:beta-galactosidase